MAFINHREVERLLKNHSKMVALVNSLHVDLESAYEKEGTDWESPDDVVYALVIGGRRLDGMPRAPYKVSDSTCNVALVYRTHINMSNKGRVKSISREILEVNAVLEKIDIAVNCLDGEQKELLKWLYWHDQYKGRPISMTGLEGRRVKRERKKILSLMSQIMRVTIDDFTIVMAKINQ